MARHQVWGVRSGRRGDGKIEGVRVAVIGPADAEVEPGSVCGQGKIINGPTES
jgi:hypothetical protein